MKQLILTLLICLKPHNGFAQSTESYFSVVDQVFAALNFYLGQLIFFDLAFFSQEIEIPLTVLWLVLGATFFTFKFKFVNFRLFKHAIDITRGKFSNKNDAGEVSHFQALTTALSATVGLGNIGGVAIAIALGGPGATFWMILAGFLGMSSKFAECTLAQIYRLINKEGQVIGGPMVYLEKGFLEYGWPRLGKILSVMFSLMCIGGAFAIGTAFQVNQSLSAIITTTPFFADFPWAYGLILAVLVGFVIIGGIRRIARTASAIVPFMCVIYVLACLTIIGYHINLIPMAFYKIFSEAFSPDAMYGGFIGVLIVGFTRSAFSNEAGIGSAAIAHSAAKTSHPAKEGIVALLEPFIDTVVICTMTALVIIVTGVYNSPEHMELISGKQGAALTSIAFGSVLPWFPTILSFSVFLFAFSTIISWSYYGERCWVYLFNERTLIIYRIHIIAIVILGSISSATNVVSFGDSMVLAMCFPNMFGLFILRNKIKASLESYMKELKKSQIN